MRSCRVVLALLAAAPRARAGVVEPEERADDEFDVMNVLARRHQHDLNAETWNAYGQGTWIETLKLPFHAPYTDVGGSTNSLSPDLENSFTLSATLYGGVKLWPDAALYVPPQMVS